MLDHRLAKEVLEQAGSIALQHFQKVTPSFKSNHTYVTEADLAVQAYLRTEFEKRFPSAGLIGEEENLRKPPSRNGPCFVIDPIDGTASFVAGMPIWGISVGIVEKLRPVAGYFYMPVTKDFFWSSLDGGTYRNGVRAHMRPFEELHSESVLLTESQLHMKYRIDPAFLGKVRSLGSTVAHLCYTATGSADAVLTGRVHVWDLASGFSMLFANGGCARYIGGEEFEFTDAILSGQKLQMPVIAGDKRIIERFLRVVSYGKPP